MIQKNVESILKLFINLTKCCFCLQINLAYAIRVRLRLEQTSDDELFSGQFKLKGLEVEVMNKGGNRIDEVGRIIRYCTWAVNRRREAILNGGQFRPPPQSHQLDENLRSPDGNDTSAYLNSVMETCTFFPIMVPHATPIHYQQNMHVQMVPLSALIQSPQNTYVQMVPQVAPNQRQQNMYIQLVREHAPPTHMSIGQYLRDSEIILANTPQSGANDFASIPQQLKPLNPHMSPQNRVQAAVSSFWDLATPAPSQCQQFQQPFRNAAERGLSYPAPSQDPSPQDCVNPVGPSYLGINSRNPADIEYLLELGKREAARIHQLQSRAFPPLQKAADLSIPTETSYGGARFGPQVHTTTSGFTTNPHRQQIMFHADQVNNLFATPRLMNDGPVWVGVSNSSKTRAQQRAQVHRGDGDVLIAQEADFFRPSSGIVQSSGPVQIPAPLAQNNNMFTINNEDLDGDDSWEGLINWNLHSHVVS